MKIQIENYELEQEVNSPTKFNLSKISIIPEVNAATGIKNKSAGERASKVIAFGVTLRHAVELIAAAELLEIEKTVTMREYCDSFDDQLKRIELLLSPVL